MAKQTRNITKAKQVGFIAVVSLGALLVLNTIARRSPAVAQVQNKIVQGL